MTWREVGDPVSIAHLNHSFCFLNVIFHFNLVHFEM